MRQYTLTHPFSCTEGVTLPENRLPLRNLTTGEPLIAPVFEVDGDGLPVRRGVIRPHGGIDSLTVSIKRLLVDWSFTKVLDDHGLLTQQKGSTERRPRFWVRVPSEDTRGSTPLLEVRTLDFGYTRLTVNLSHFASMRDATTFLTRLFPNFLEAESRITRNDFKIDLGISSADLIPCVEVLRKQTLAALFDADASGDTATSVSLGVDFAFVEVGLNAASNSLRFGGADNEEVSIYDKTYQLIRKGRASSEEMKGAAITRVECRLSGRKKRVTAWKDLPLLLFATPFAGVRFRTVAADLDRAWEAGDKKIHEKLMRFWTICGREGLGMARKATKGEHLERLIQDGYLKFEPYNLDLDGQWALDFSRFMGIDPATAESLKAALAARTDLTPEEAGQPVPFD